jgi:hypothetical protein
MQEMNWWESKVQVNWPATLVLWAVMLLHLV